MRKRPTPACSGADLETQRHAWRTGVRTSTVVVEYVDADLGIAYALEEFSGRRVSINRGTGGIDLRTLGVGTRLKVVMTAFEHAVLAERCDGGETGTAADDPALTTEQAANLAGVPGPFMAKLIDTGAVKLHETGGNQRRVLLSTLLRWLANERARQAKAITHLGQGIDADSERAVKRAVDLMNDLDADDGAPPDAPIVLCAIDDVLCLSDPVGRQDAVDAIRGMRIDADWVFEHLMHKPAVEVLRVVHDALAGHVRYVITSTWRIDLNRSEFAEVLRRAGLGFVADRMERRSRWSTPDWSSDGQSRLNEIAEWLRRHANGEPFVMLDDTFSGGSLVKAGSSPASPFFGRVVICDERVGLLPSYVDFILAALRTPVALSARVAVPDGGKSVV